MGKRNDRHTRYAYLLLLRDTQEKHHSRTYQWGRGLTIITQNIYYTPRPSRAGLSPLTMTNGNVTFCFSYCTGTSMDPSNGILSPEYVISCMLVLLNGKCDRNSLYDSSDTAAPCPAACPCTSHPISHSPQFLSFHLRLCILYIHQITLIHPLFFHYKTLLPHTVSVQLLSYFYRL